MSVSTRRFRRRQLLTTVAGGATLLTLPGKAPAQGGAKKLAGVTLNVTCWSGSYPKFLADYIPEFEQATGAKVNYETPSFPIYNQLADWDAGDLLPGSTAPFMDRQGRLCAIPWIADVQMAGASRYDLVQQAGLKLPDTFDEMAAMLKAVNRKGDVPGFIAENHYGWTFIPYLQGFGGNVFRNAPTDLTPTLDSPEAIEAAEFFSNMLRDYGPDGALSYTYDQVVEALRQGRINYSTNNETFLVQMVQAGSKVGSTCALSLMPGGPKGRFPNVAAHGWGIPVGSRNKDAAWEFIKWSMSKELTLRMFNDHGYSSVTRRSMIARPEFREKMRINGVDVAQLYLDTLQLGAKGYTVYRTVPPYPPVDHEIDVAIQNIVSKQKTAKEAMAQAQQNALMQLKRAGVKL
jgi:multiple sugar transport system substrate-binding protein